MESEREPASRDTPAHGPDDDPIAPPSADVPDGAAAPDAPDDAPFDDIGVPYDPDPGAVSGPASGVALGPGARCAPVGPDPFALAAAALALFQFGLAALARTFVQVGFCPSTQEGGLGCSALIRPRLGELGPISVSELGLWGALATVAFALVFLLADIGQPLLRGLVRAAVVLPAAGAGFALGIQALSVAAAGAVCPICLLLAGVSLVTAVLLAAVARRAADIPWQLPAAALVVVLGVTAPLAWARGAALRDDDAARRSALAQAGGAAGPQLLLVSRPGCPYCEALLMDSLGDPSVVPLLEWTRGVRVVSPDDPDARPHLRHGGVPILLAVDADGALLGRLEGYEPADILQEWLLERLSEGGHLPGSTPRRPADATTEPNAAKSGDEPDRAANGDAGGAGGAGGAGAASDAGGAGGANRREGDEPR